MPLERPTTVMEIVAVVVVLKERDIEPTTCQLRLTPDNRFKNGWWENDVITITTNKQTKHQTFLSSLLPQRELSFIPHLHDTARTTRTTMQRSKCSAFRSSGTSLCIYFLNISLVIIYRERVWNMNSLSYNDNEWMSPHTTITTLTSGVRTNGAQDASCYERYFFLHYIFYYIKDFVWISFA